MLVVIREQLPVLTNVKTALWPRDYCQLESLTQSSECSVQVVLDDLASDKVTLMAAEVQEVQQIHQGLR